MKEKWTGEEKQKHSWDTPYDSILIRDDSYVHNYIKEYNTDHVVSTCI